LRLGGDYADAIVAGSPPISISSTPIFRASGSGSIRQAGTLSGGEQQIWRLGPCAELRPRLMLLDGRPLAWRRFIVEELFENLRRLNRERRFGMLIVECITRLGARPRRARLPARNRADLTPWRARRKNRQGEGGAPLVSPGIRLAIELLLQQLMQARTGALYAAMALCSGDDRTSRRPFSISRRAKWRCSRLLLACK